MNHSTYRPIFQSLLCTITVAVCFFGGVGCPAATLTTTDGTTYVGVITLHQGDIVEIADAKQGVQRIPLAKVADLNVARPPVGPDPMIAVYQQREKQNIPTVALREVFPTTMPSTQPSSLENGWLQADIGNVVESGTGSISGPTITAAGSGWGCWGAKDSGHFVCRNVRGDFDCAVHLGKLPTGNAPFHEGLIVRQSLADDSPMAALIARPDDSPRITNRPLALNDKHSAIAGGKPFTWMRLIRCADAVSALVSSDGVAWVPTGWVKLKMGSDVLIGVGCAAIANQQVETATFDQFSLTTGMYGPTRGIALTDGTRLPAEIHQFDGKSAVFALPNQAERTIPASMLAAIVRQPLPSLIGNLIPTDKPTLYLATGDSIDIGGEGSSLAVHDGHIDLTSELLGQQTFTMDQIALAMIAPIHPQDSIRVSTSDGALYYCKSVSASDTSLILVTALGTVDVDAKLLVELRRIQDTTVVQK